jgi:hypothetical protein
MQVASATSIAIDCNLKIALCARPRFPRRGTHVLMNVRIASLVCVAALVMACGSSSSSNRPDQGGVGGNGGSGGSGGGGSGGSGGGNGGNGGSGGGNGGNGGSGGGGGGGGTFECGTVSCGNGQVCCVTGTTPTCATTCGADGGFIASCRSPLDCSGNPCCVTVTSGYHVSGVMCAQSKSDCVPMIDIGTGAGKERGCNTNADCTDGISADMMLQLPDCCTNTTTMQKTCFNKAFTAVINTFTCP